MADTFPPLTVSRKALLEDSGDQAFRQMVYDLLTVSVRMQRVRDEVAGLLGVTGPQHSILMYIAHFAGDRGVSVKETADHLHVSGAFVTVEVKKLMDCGWLHKLTDPDDRRRVRLLLSPEGERRITDIAPVLCRINDMFFGGLSSEDFDRLRDMAARLVDGSEDALGLMPSSLDAIASA
jgi:DNA-binding MarR family transcriptional regulator